MEDLWHCVSIKAQEGLRCFSFMVEYIINCNTIVNIGRVKKGYGYFGFKIDFKSDVLTNSHFETEISHDFSVFIYPFLTRASAECEIREIEDVMKRAGMKRKAEEERKEKEEKKKNVRKYRKKTSSSPRKKA